MNHTLLIPLFGPMQAWGTRSRFDDRDTHQEPTKSGVLGLVCAALGRKRTEPLDDLIPLRFGVRVDLPGIAMSDYQTAQNVLKAAGAGTTTVTSRRHYLCDAGFLTGLEGDRLDLLHEIEAALRNPVWCLSLGRKSFPLTVPPYFPDGSIREGLSLETALREEPWRPLSRLREWETRPNSIRLLFENEKGQSGVLFDTPISFNDRHFVQRRLEAASIEYIQEGEPWCTFHS